jgi:phage shock protein A
MTETLVVRVKRIVSANISDVVDRLEKSQAEIVMKEAVREVDRAISDIRTEQGKALQRSKQASNQIESYTAKLADLNVKLDFAVSQNRDDLAKAAISRQVDFEAQVKVLTEAAADAEAEQLKLADYVVALDARKRDMESELKVIAQAKAEAEAAMPDVMKKDGPIARADNAAEAFKRAMESANHLSGAKSASSEDSAKLAELDKLSHAEMIERRLQEAKLRKSA